MADPLHSKGAEGRRKRALLAPALLVFAASFATYSPALFNGFVYDDHSQVLGNAWIRDYRYIPDILTSSGRGFLGERANTFRPLLHLFFMAEYHVFGLKAWGFHLVNVLMHSANSLLVFLIARRLFERTEGEENRAGRIVAIGRDSVIVDHGPPFFAALFFALHPANSEPVAWVSAIPELAFTLFLLLSLLVFTGLSGGRSGLLMYTASLTFFFLALLGKETAMSLLFIAAAYSASGKKTEGAKALMRLVPFLAVAALYMALRSYAVGGVVYRKQIDLSLYGAFINAFPLVLGYAWKIIYPAGLNALYEFREARTILDPRVLGGIAVAAACGAALFFSRSDRAVFTGVVTIGAPLLPVLYVPALSSAAFADRYLYLPTIGFAIILASFIRLAASRPNRSALAAAALIAIAITALYGAGTVKRTFVWKDDYTLWEDTVRKSPGNPNVQYNFAWASGLKGDSARAEEHYRESIRLAPGFADAHYNLGVIYLNRDDFDAAIAEFAEAARLDGSFTGARERLAEALRLKALKEEKNSEVQR